MFEIHNTSALFLLLLIPVLMLIGIRTYDKAGRRRKWLMALLRAAVVLLLVADMLTLEIWWKDSNRKRCVYYAVDLSTSMQPYRRELAQTVANCLRAKDSRTWCGVIVFDAKPRVVVPAGPDPDIELAVKVIEGQDAGTSRSASASEQETDIAAAIRLAMSSFPGDRSKRICLISDGNETTGDAIQQAGFAKAAGVDIVTLTPEIKLRGDIAVDRIQIDRKVHLNEAFTVKVSLTSSFEKRDVDGHKIALRLYRNNFVVGDEPVSGARGSRSVVFRQVLDRGGRFVYEARLVTDLNQSRDNDRATTYFEVKDVPRVLLIANDRAEQQVMRDALRTPRLNLEVRPPSGVPQSMLDLQDFAAVIIGNVASDRISVNQMKLLHDYVKEFGGGLIVCGGDQALSAGGYAGTPLEKALPVRCSFKETESATAALVLVVDNSISMRIHNEDFKGDKPLFIQRFVSRAADVFSDRDYIGIIGLAGETTSPTWLLPLQHAVDPARIKKTPVAYKEQSHLARSLHAAYVRLERVDATRKAIIIITDGYLVPGPDYARMAMQLASGEVSISSVAVGQAANHKLLAQIARYGNGRYYAAQTLEQADRMLEREVEEFARAVVIERPVDALNLKQGDIFRGIDIDLCPTLFGYVRVKPKLAAQTLLILRQTRDPLLVTWSYGAGRAIVFSTDIAGKWSQLWTKEWSRQYARLWQNLIDSVASTGAGTEYIPRVTVNGWEQTFEIDAVDKASRFVNDEFPVAVLYPLGEKGQLFSEESRIPITTRLAGPGLYRGRYTVQRSGVYLFKVARKNGTGVRTTGAVVSVNKEQASLLPNRALQNRICEITGGTLTVDPKQVYAHVGAGKRRPRDAGTAFLLTACALFVLNIGARRWPAIVGFWNQQRGVRG